MFPGCFLWCSHPVLTRELVITNDLICHLSIGAGVVVLDVGKGVEFLPTPFSREVENSVKSVAVKTIWILCLLSRPRHLSLARNDA